MQNETFIGIGITIVGTWNIQMGAKLESVEKMFTGMCCVTHPLNKVLFQKKITNTDLHNSFVFAKQY